MRTSNPKIIACLAITMLLLVSSLFVFASITTAAPPDDGLFVETVQRGTTVKSPDQSIMRSRYVDLRLALFDSSLAPASSRTAVGASKTITLNLFSDVTLIAVLDRVQVQPNGFTWTGHVVGAPNSKVIFVVRNGILSGSITTPQAVFQVRYAGNKVHQVRQVNTKAFRPERNPVPVDKSTLQARPVSPRAQTVDDGSEIDMLVVYTPAASQNEGGDDAMESLIVLAAEEANQVLENSQVTARVHQVSKSLVEYAESGDLETDLKRLQNPSDGFLDGVPALRTKFGADVVTLVVEGGQYCGTSFDVMNPVSAAFAPYALTVVSRDCLVGNYVFVHELGHVLSARHDWTTDNTDNAPFTFNHGWVLPSKTARTVMAYPDNCPNGCNRIPYFSNPALSYNGEPLGSATANNALTLNTTANTVANFMHAAVVITPSVPVLIAPTATITNPFPAYQWKVSTNATHYQLTVDGPNGNVVREWYEAAKICDSATCSVLSPARLVNGKYSWSVRAWNSAGSSDCAGTANCACACTNFTLNGVPEPPILIGPSGTVTNTSVVFTWYLVGGATQYNLSVNGKTISVPTGSCSGAVCLSTQVLGAGTYPWTVQACNEAGCSATSASKTVMVSVPGMDPRAISPSGTVADNPPAFVWTQVQGATIYAVWVKGGSPVYENVWNLDFSPQLCAGGGNCSFKPTTAFPAGEYAWKVRACNAATCGNWSNELRFTIPAPSTCALTQLEPKTLVNTNKPTFKWSYSGRCDFIFVWVSGGGRTDSQWVIPNSQTCPGGVCSWTPSSTFPNAKYTWYLYGYPGGGWTGPMNFEIGSPQKSGFVSPPWTSWQAVSGTWSIIGTAPYLMYYTAGVPGRYSSSMYKLEDYDDLEYEVLMLRTGCAWCAHGIDIRGVPGALDGGWMSAYQFEINRNGYFSVWRGIDDHWVAMQSWSYSPAILKGDASNRLRVVMVKQKICFYINGVLVWTGSDAALTSGKVGVFTTDDDLYVRGAMLSIPSLNALDGRDVSVQQKQYNADGNTKKQGSLAEGPH